TDASGKTTVTLTSLTPGKVTVTASINDSSMETEVQFVEDGSNDPTAYISALTVSKNTAVADGRHTNEVVAEVVSGDGRLLAGQGVNFTATNGAEIDELVVTDEYGKAVATLTSLTPGISIVTALINSSSEAVNVIFTEATGNDPTAEVIALRTLDDQAAADGQATNRVMAEVADSNHVLLANQSVTFLATNDAEIVSPVLTDAGGKATTTLTSTSEGTVKVTAVINVSARSTDVTFIEGGSTNPDAVIAGVYIEMNNAVADGVAVNTVVAEVVDGDNRLLANQNVHFEADNGAVIQANPVLTDEYGKAIVSLSSLTAGACQVTASINESTDSVTVNFAEGGGNDPSAEIETVTVSKDNARADGVESNEVTATVTDGGGNPLDGQHVRFEADNGAVIQSPAVTDTTGKATTTLTSTTAGQSTVTASINDSAETAVVSFTDESSISVIDSLVSDKDSIVNDGTDIATLTATVIDSDTGNVVSGAAVSWSTDIGTVTPATSVTDERGEAVTQLSDTGDTGTATVTAALNSGEEKTYPVTLQGPVTLAVRGGRRRRGVGRGSLSCLVAIDLLTGQPVTARWQYEGDEAFVTAVRFADPQPEKPLQVVSVTGQQGIVLTPLNVAGFTMDPAGDAFGVVTSTGGGLAWGSAASGGAVPSDIVTRTDLTVPECTSYAYAVLTRAGGVVSWGNSTNGGNVPSAIATRTDLAMLASTDTAFAALTTSGGAVAWGDGRYGGNVPTAIATRTDLVTLSSSNSAFAALTQAGGVVAWGDSTHGGSVPSAVATRTDLVTLNSTDRAFGALTASRGVVAWGTSEGGGNVPTEIATRADLVELGSNAYAFAALTKAGGVVAWGYNDFGGNVPTAIATRTDLVAMAGSRSAFASLTASGGVVAWGESSYGGGVPTEIGTRTDLIALASTDHAFAALTASGGVVAWGESASGGTIPAEIQPLLTDIVAVYGCDRAFCALKSDNTVVVWGGGDAGKMANIPEALQGNVLYYQE
ncbi:Ig-like domain-containing protein, partial [Serratia quinivorans]